jgi:hypothetical protein
MVVILKKSQILLCGVQFQNKRRSF